MLARWRHPQRGLVSPDLFVGMAEDTGAINVLTEWSLRQTIACQKRLAAQGLITTLAVNLSGRLLNDSAFIAVAIGLLAQRAGDLYLEITETATIDNQDRALENINALVAAGAFISIDDYAAGPLVTVVPPAHSRARVEDRQGVRAIAGRTTARRAAGEVHHRPRAFAGHESDGSEGVETDVARAALTAMGCDVIQGYLVAMPSARKRSSSSF